MDVEPDHDVEPAFSLFSHVCPFRQDSHNTEGRDDKNSQQKISSNQFGLLQHQSRFSIPMQVYTLMLFLKALHDFKMLNDSSLIGGARFHYCQPINVIWYHFSAISKVFCISLPRWFNGPGNGRVRGMFPHPSALSYTQGVYSLRYLNKLYTKIYTIKKRNLKSEIKHKFKRP